MVQAQWHLSQDGNVYFCNMLSEEYTLGNIYKQNLSDIIAHLPESDSYKKFNELSQKIFQNKVLNGVHSTICILKERIITA